MMMTLKLGQPLQTIKAWLMYPTEWETSIKMRSLAYLFGVVGEHLPGLRLEDVSISFGLFFWVFLI